MPFQLEPRIVLQKVSKKLRPFDWWKIEILGNEEPYACFQKKVINIINNVIKLKSKILSQVVYGCIT